MNTEEQWISVTDKLPDIAERCLVYNSISVEPAIYTATGEFARYPNELKGDRVALYHFDLRKVTHWQPFPLPPKP
jgi:hypothetical protein